AAPPPAAGLAVAVDHDGAVDVFRTASRKASLFGRLFGETPIDPVAPSPRRGAEVPPVAPPPPAGASLLDRMKLRRTAPSDSLIATRCRSLLSADPALARCAVLVEVVRSEVRLSGTVSGDDLRVRAGRVAERTDGVTRVVNLIAVTPPMPQWIGSTGVRLAGPQTQGTASRPSAPSGPPASINILPPPPAVIARTAEPAAPRRAAAFEPAYPEAPSTAVVALLGGDAVSFSVPRAPDAVLSRSRPTVHGAPPRELVPAGPSQPAASLPTPSVEPVIAAPTVVESTVARTVQPAPLSLAPPAEVSQELLVDDEAPAVVSYEIRRRIPALELARRSMPGRSPGVQLEPSLAAAPRPIPSAVGTPHNDPLLTPTSAFLPAPPVPQRSRPTAGPTVVMGWNRRVEPDGRTVVETPFLKTPPPARLQPMQPMEPFPDDRRAGRWRWWFGPR
ncbi:MAG: BON domain-containing protein, partial [Planctomycetia bacterium]